MKILELTGDTTEEELAHDYSLYLEANLIITTPEKFIKNRNISMLLFR